MGRRYRSHRGGRGGGGNLLGLILAAPIIMIIAGIIVALSATESQYFSTEYIGAKEQVYKEITSGSKKETAFIEVGGGEVPKGLASYIFAREPKRSYSTKNLPVHNMNDVMRSTFDVPSIQGTTISFDINVTAPVDLEYSGYYSGRPYVIYSRKDISVFAGSFVVDDSYTSPRFELTGLSRFSGSLSVSTSNLRYDVDSIKYEDKCTNYPCTFDLEEDAFYHSNVWIITENSGTKEYSILSGQKSVSYTKLIVGIAVAAVGFLIVIGGCLLCFVCILKA